MCCRALSKRGMSSLDLASKVMAEISTSAQLHLWVDGLAHKFENSLFLKIFDNYMGLQAAVFKCLRVFGQALLKYKRSNNKVFDCLLIRYNAAGRQLPRR